MRGVDLEVYGLAVDAFVVSCYPCRLRLNLPLNLGEVVKSPPWVVEKFCPFCLSCYASRCVRNVDFVVFRPVFAVARQIDELQDQRAAGNDATSSGQKVSTNNVFEDGRLSRRLRANDNLFKLVFQVVWLVELRGSQCHICARGGGVTYNLGQIKGIIPDGVEDQILQTVDNVEQLLTQRGHGAGRCIK